MTESYLYKDGCFDRYQNFSDTFDQVELYNPFQHTGLLNLVYDNNDVTKHLNYPILNISSKDILLSKKEEKFRFNYIVDSTFDRGQFTTNTEQAYINHPNGYTRDLNINYFNYSKILRPHQLRNSFNSVLLRKTLSGPNNIICKFNNLKFNHSVL